MNTNALIIVPITIMMVLAAFGMGGMGATVPNMNQTFYQWSTGTDAYGNALTLYTHDGDPVCYYNGTSCYGEAGLIISYAADTYPPMEAAWQNQTTYYQLFYDVLGDEPVYYADLKGGVVSRPEGRMGANWENLQPFNLSDSWGWLALVAAIIGIGSIVGFKLFGSGESETSVMLLLKGSFFITIWAVLTAMSYQIILSAGASSGGFLIFILYFGLTLAYAVGVIMNVGGSA